MPDRKKRPLDFPAGADGFGGKIEVHSAFVSAAGMEVAALAEGDSTKRPNTSPQPNTIISNATKQPEPHYRLSKSQGNTTTPGSPDFLSVNYLKALFLLAAAFPALASEIPEEIQSLPASPGAALAAADKVVTYKSVDGLDLEMFLYFPEKTSSPTLHPGILFMHGGGWTTGGPSAHAYDCIHLARHGMVAATIRYRLIPDPSRTQTRWHAAATPADCLADAKSAMRFFRANADEYAMDPQKIAAGGGSAGGHLAAALATIEGYDDPNDDPAISCKPQALVLLYPAINLGDGWKNGARLCREAGIEPEAFSPGRLVDETTPPTLIAVGGDDPVYPPAISAAFLESMKSAGRFAEIYTYPGRNHSLFPLRKDNLHFQSFLIVTRLFLQNQGWIEKRPVPPLPAVEFIRTSSEDG